MKGFKIFFWVMAIIISLGCISLIADNDFDIYTLIELVYSWIIVYYAEQQK